MASSQHYQGCVLAGDGESKDIVEVLRVSDANVLALLGRPGCTRLTKCQDRPLMNLWGHEFACDNYVKPP